MGRRPFKPSLAGMPDQIPAVVHQVERKAGDAAERIALWVLPGPQARGELDGAKHRAVFAGLQVQPRKPRTTGGAAAPDAGVLIDLV